MPEYWSGLPFPPPGDLPDPSTEPTSWQAILYHWALLKLTQCYMSIACMRAKSLHSRLTLCDPVDRSLSGSSVHGILQARILEGVAMPVSRGSSQPRDWTHVSYIFCTGRQFLFFFFFLAGSFFTTCATLYFNKAGGSDNLETYLKKITHRKGRNIC